MNYFIMVIFVSIFAVMLSCDTSMSWNTKKCRENYYDSNSADSRCFRLQTELSEQAGNGNLEAVKQAVAEGANVNAVADSSFLPLADAASGGHDVVVSFLLAQEPKLTLRRHCSLGGDKR